jgi:hypothetical protein
LFSVFGSEFVSPARIDVPQGPCAGSVPHSQPGPEENLAPDIYRELNRAFYSARRRTTSAKAWGTWSCGLRGARISTCWPGKIRRVFEGGAL